MNRQWCIKFGNGEWFNEPMTYAEAKDFVGNWERYSQVYSAAIIDVINEDWA